MKTLVLLNAAAGTIRNGQPQDFETKVREGLATRGIDAVVETVSGSDIPQLAHRFALAGRGDHVLVIGGGDGTLSGAASAIAGTDTVMGVLPLGTFNHFAKDLGIPNTLDAALDIIAAGHRHSIDVAEVNGRLFINNSSIGIYPFLVAERTAEQERRGVGKLAAFFPALYRTLRSASWHNVKLSVEGDLKEVRTPCVFIGNNLYDLGSLGQRKALDAGELCVYVVKRQSWLGLALLPFKIFFGLINPALDVEAFHVRNLEIRTRRRRAMQIALDGETIDAETPLQYKIRPQGLTVLAPQTAPAPPA